MTGRLIFGAAAVLALVVGTTAAARGRRPVADAAVWLGSLAALLAVFGPQVGAW